LKIVEDTASSFHQKVTNFQTGELKAEGQQEESEEQLSDLSFN